MFLVLVFADFPNRLYIIKLIGDPRYLRFNVIIQLLFTDASSKAALFSLNLDCISDQGLKFFIMYLGERLKTFVSLFGFLYENHYLINKTIIIIDY